MRCAEVKPQLPELAEAGLRAVGEAEVHLASCAACSAEMDRYRRILSDMGTLTELVADPGPAFLDRILSDLPPPERLPLLRRALADQRVHRAALSLGGAMVGATAVALVWWRRSRRPEADPALSALSAAGPQAS